MQFVTYSGSHFSPTHPRSISARASFRRRSAIRPMGRPSPAISARPVRFGQETDPAENPAYRIGLLIAVTFCIQGRSTTAASMAALIGRLYMMKTLILGVSALSMTALPVAANAATAAPAGANAARALSVSRAGTSTSKSSKLAGLQGASIAPIVIGVGILAGVTYLIIDNENDNDRSDSN